jgi:hypothetical protein
MHRRQNGNWKGLCPVQWHGVGESIGGAERCQSNMSMELCSDDADNLTDTLIRVMEACLRRLRTMKAVSATDRKQVMAVLKRMDVTACRSQEKQCLMTDIHREWQSDLNTAPQRIDSGNRTCFTAIQRTSPLTCPHIPPNIPPSP